MTDAPHTGDGPARPPQRRSVALLGAVGLACLACLLPVVLAAGAAGSLAAAFGGEIAVVAAVALGLGAVAVVLRRRARSDDACGC